MGRGRAKAKQIKVARKLKYSTPSTDLTALERELHASRGGDSFTFTEAVDEVDETDEDDDPYAAYYADDEDEDDDDDQGQSWAVSSRS